jgi:hypothetical protein
VEQRCRVRIIASAERLVQLRLRLDRFSWLTFPALAQHGYDGADDFEMAKFLCGDIGQHILTAGIDFDSLSEISASCGELAPRITELFKQQIR